MRLFWSKKFGQSNNFHCVLKLFPRNYSETLINNIQSSEKIPNRIALEKEETRFFLAKICSQYDIKIELIEQLQVIPEVRAELLKGNF